LPESAAAPVPPWEGSKVIRYFNAVDCGQFEEELVAK
jgi:hypothetical protein